MVANVENFLRAVKRNGFMLSPVVPGLASLSPVGWKCEPGDFCVPYVMVRPADLKTPEAVIRKIQSRFANREALTAA